MKLLENYSRAQFAGVAITTVVVLGFLISMIFMIFNKYDPKLVDDARIVFEQKMEITNSICKYSRSNYILNCSAKMNGFPVSYFCVQERGCEWSK